MRIQLPGNIKNATVVLDTNICLDLIVFRDRHYEPILNLLENRLVKAVTRNDCRDEWLRVLTYPVFSLEDTAIKKYTADYDRLISISKYLSKNYSCIPCCADQDDQKFLELAYDAAAAFLLTKDKLLLKLSARVRKKGLFNIIHPDNFKALL